MTDVRAGWVTGRHHPSEKVFFLYIAGLGRNMRQPTNLSKQLYIKGQQDRIRSKSRLMCDILVTAKERDSGVDVVHRYFASEAARQLRSFSG